MQNRKNKLMKTLSIILSVCIACSSFFVLAFAAQKTGDVDGDGNVTSADARLALRASVNLEQLTRAQKLAADVDLDGKITAADARLILRASVGLEDLTVVGVWKNEEVIYTFRVDGTGETADPATGMGAPFEYEVSGDKLTIRANGPENSETATFAFPDNDTLKLTFADNKTITLTRAVEENPIVGTWKNDDVVYTFNVDGTGETADPATGMGAPFEYEISGDTLTIRANGPENPETATFTFTDNDTLKLTFADNKTVTLTRTVEENPIVGTWKNDDVVYTFNVDGTGETADPATGMGAPFEYEVSGDKLTIRANGPENPETATFTLADDTLTLTLTFADNKTVTLTRAAEENPIVGTWKDDDVVYTFNADGTGETTDSATDTGAPFEYLFAELKRKEITK